MVEGATTFSILQARVKRRKSSESVESNMQALPAPSETFSIPASSLVRRPVKKIKLKIDPDKLKALQKE